MRKLRTVYPYGLNDRTGTEYKNEEIYQLAGKGFSTLIKNVLHKDNTFLALMIFSINSTDFLLISCQIQKIFKEHH